jgi:hypothetical protein
MLSHLKFMREKMALLKLGDFPAKKAKKKK